MKTKKPLHEEPEWIYPFDSMEIGESFFIPTLKPATIIYSAYNGARRSGIRVRCFTTVKEGVMGVRVWRIR